MRISPIRIYLSFLILIVSLGGTIAFNRSVAVSPLKLEDIPSLSIEHVQRLLVVAPHPDDEILGAGGLIQVALQQGSAVKVVLMTNGDGQLFAPGLIDHRLTLRPEHYIAMGERRQKESLAALKVVGLGSKRVIFLGYPDRGLAQLWSDDWNTGCPRQTRYTGSTHSPYRVTFRPDARYCGIDVLADLVQILQDFRPNLVVIPHPNDNHSDHQAASNFTRLAVAQVEQQEPEYVPSVLGYLVHYGEYPARPRGRQPAQLLPPAPLTPEGAHWMRFGLTLEQLDRKKSALQKYRSQIRLMGRFLNRFGQGNELFLELEDLELPALHIGALDLTETEEDGPIQLKEPARESMEKAVAAGADLTGWKVVRVGDSLFITADLRGRLIPGAHYRLYLKTPAGDTFEFGLKSAEVTPAVSSFTAQIQLDEIGDPAVIGFSAEVFQGTILDRTGWTFARLRP